MSTINIKCPDCGTNVTGKYGFIFNRTLTCPKCRKTIDPRKDSIQVVHCDHCGNDVMYDTTKGPGQVCPVCQASLDKNRYGVFDVKCPTCGMMQEVRNGETDHVCAICGTEFDVAQSKAKIDAANSGKATVITVPAYNDEVIFRHEQNQFPYASRVIVPEGYTGLLLYNGRCSEPSEPGSYLLAESMRTLDEDLKRAALDDETLVHVQVFFVRNAIDKRLGWGEPAVQVTDRDGKIVGTMGMGGAIESLRIINSKKFAEFVGYESATAQELLFGRGDFDPKNAPKLFTKVRSICFQAAYRVLMYEVRNYNKTYEALNADRLILTRDVEQETNRDLAEIGLKCDVFTMDHITFTQDERVTREEEEALNEAKQAEMLLKIQAYVHEQVKYLAERPMDWTSPEITIHMKGDMTKKADVVYGGTMKLWISDEEAFFSRSEVKHWFEKLVAEAQMKMAGVSDMAFAKDATEQMMDQYCSEIAKQATQNVLSDIMQPMIDDTEADIRDMTYYYRYIREKIQNKLSDRFEKYGMKVEDFSLSEVSRKASRALTMMTEAAEHKSEEQIRMDVYKFDEDNKMDIHAYNQGNRVKKADIDAGTSVELDSIDLDREKAMRDHDHIRTELAKDRATDEAGYRSHVDDIARQEKLKKTEWKRQDELDEMGYTHHVNTVAAGYTSEDLENEQKLRRQVQGYKDEQKDHDQREEIHDIEVATEKARSLHYLNVEEIESRADEIRRQWEADSKLDYDRLMHSQRKERATFDAKKGYRLEENEINRTLRENDAESERVVKGILRKIDESNLEFREKVEAYNRMMGIQRRDDELYFTEKEGKLKTDLHYNDAHVKNILTREENDIYEEMAQRAEDRQERKTNADFVRDMHVKEMAVAHEMELLKLQYERDARKDEMEERLRDKDREIVKLKLMVEHYENLGEQDIRRLGIRETGETRRLDIREVNETARKTAEAKYKNEHEREEREYQDRRERERMAREDDYSKRADELLSRVLSIQASLKRYAMETDRIEIQERAGVAKKRVEADRDQAKELDKLIEEMKKLTESIDRSSKAMKTVADNSKKKKKNQPGGGSNGSGDGYGGSRNGGYGGSRDYDRGGRDYDRGGRDYDRGDRDYGRGDRDYGRGDRDYDRGSRDNNSGYDRGGRDSGYGSGDRQPGSTGYSSTGKRCRCGAELGRYDTTCPECGARVY